MTPRREPTGGISERGVESGHIPVLLAEVLERLQPRDGERFIDATFGAGGYSRAILNAADCRLTALDRDPSAFASGQAMVEEFSPRLDLRLAPFSRLYDWARPEGCHQDTDFAGAFDGVVFDLGVSSMQLDQPDRGFSFQADGPLDMRMFSAGGSATSGDGASQSRAEEGPSAADVVNTFSEAELADIIFQLGEEKRSRAVARAIVARRAEKPFERTLDLAQTVEAALGGRRGQARHPATQTFQALRIFVNDELGQLLLGLAGAERCLKPGGRLVVVTFHSLEDRIAKRFFAARAGRDSGVSRHMPGPGKSGPRPSFQIVNHRALTSSKGEAEMNPRSRSARLRSGERTDALAWRLSAADLGLPGIARRGLEDLD